MKTALTIEQSTELIKRGVSERRATSSVWSPSENAYIHPTFTLADLLSLLPKQLYGEETDYCDCELHIHANKLGWSTLYIEIRGGKIMVEKFTSHSAELIDALFSLLCKLIDNHVKLD